jgi:hypothetical protein
MAVDQFHIIKEICRAGLRQPETPDLRTSITKLRDALAEQSRQAHTRAMRSVARQQTDALTRLLKLYKSANLQRPDKPAGAKTAVGLKRDAVSAMLRRGSLCPEHYLAAEQIREIYQALVSGFTATPRPPMEAAPRPRKAAAWYHPFERMPDRLVRLYHDRYRPWSSEMGGLRCGGKTHLELTIDVVVDGYSLHGIETHQALRHGTASTQLRAALQRYAEIAGWLERSENGRISAPGPAPGGRRHG